MIDREEANSGIINKATKQTDYSKGLELIQAKQAEIEAIGKEEYYKLRKYWSWFILVWITTLILFNISLTILVGFQALDFSEMKWFIAGVTIETFLQIVGMGYIAVKFLFSHK